MIPKSGYRFSEKIMLEPLVYCTREQGTNFRW